MEREFFEFAQTNFGVAPEDVHEVPLRFDAASMLRRMKKAHGSGGLRRNGEEEEVVRSSARAKAAAPMHAGEHRKT